jgi:hypothetical protein
MKLYSNDFSLLQVKWKHWFEFENSVHNQIVGCKNLYLLNNAVSLITFPSIVGQLHFQLSNCILDREMFKNKAVLCSDKWYSVAQSSEQAPFTSEIVVRFSLRTHLKSQSTLCRKSWVFSGCSGFHPHGKLAGWVRINTVKKVRSQLL